MPTRVALVTGAARRVGRAIALELARSGYDVAVHYHHSKSEAERVVAEVESLGRRAATVEGDLARAENAAGIISAAVDRLNGLSLLVNNASVFYPDGSDSLSGMNFDRWRRTLEINVVAPAALCAAAHPHLRAAGDGCVVNLTDISAERPWPDHLAYCASKAALVNLTRSLARAMAPAVRVNAVAPGIAEFPKEYSPDLRARLTEAVPLCRAGSPEEVARLIHFIAVEGTYLTGQVISIDGGRGIA